MAKKATLAALLSVLLISSAAVRAEEQEAPTPSSGVYIMEIGQLKTGDKVPVFKARGIYGTEVNLEEMLKRGNHVILSFWSMYCLACIEKFEALVSVQEKYQPRGVRVISLNTDGEYKNGEEAVRTFLADLEKRHGIKVNFPVLYDERNWVAQALRIEFLPTIISLDPAGCVFGIYQKFNENSKEEIRAGIESIVLQQLAAFPPPDAAVALPEGAEKK